MSLEINFKHPYWLDDSHAEQDFVLLLRSKQSIDKDLEHCKQIFRNNQVEHVEETLITQTQSEFGFKSTAQQAWAVFESLLAVVENQNFDVSVIPQATRSKKLLVCDMDSTIVASETLDDVAEKVGIGERVKQITERAMRGELDFQQALDERVSLFSGLSESLFFEIAHQVTLNAGAEKLIATANANKIKTVLVSGGFEPIVKYIAEQLKFDLYVCNDLEQQQGVLTGKVLQPIVDASTKLTVLKEEANRLGIGLQDTCAVGDGANDLPMLQAAGLGVAYRGKPLLKQTIPYQVNYTGLDTIAFIMGIS